MCKFQWELQFGNSAERERERDAQTEQPNTNNHTKDRREAQGKKC